MYTHRCDEPRKGSWNGVECIQFEQPRRGHVLELRRQLEEFYNFLRLDPHLLPFGRERQSSDAGRTTKPAEQQQRLEFVLRTWTKVCKRIAQNGVGCEHLLGTSTSTTTAATTLPMISPGFVTGLEGSIIIIIN
jgi:hypothetical protein